MSIRHLESIRYDSLSDVLQQLKEEFEDTPEWECIMRNARKTLPSVDSAFTPQKAKFYTFDQNNSGGDFVYDSDRGISHFVTVEAFSSEDAISRAKEVGLYFDGNGDCPCCGARWSDWLDDEDGTDEPTIYGSPIDDYFSHPLSMKWIDGYEAFVHYLDGRIEGRLKGNLK